MIQEHAVAPDISGACLRQSDAYSRSVTRVNLHSAIRAHVQFKARSF